METATGTFDVQAWNEETYEELVAGGKLTRASVTQGFQGGIEGEGSVVWLMCYSSDGTTRFVGLQRISATVGGRRGSFVAESSGDFDGERANGKLIVVTGSGTDELAGISGAGSFSAPLGSQASYSLEYTVS